MRQLWWMKALVAAVVVRLGSARLVKAAVTARSEVPVVLGVSPVDQWRCVLSDKLSVPLRGR
jgi:hypothetical protein